MPSEQVLDMEDILPTDSCERSVLPTKETFCTKSWKLPLFLFGAEK